MVNELYLIIGILVVAFTAADFFYTTVSFTGRRSLLVGLLQSTGWRWGDIYTQNDER